MTAPTRHTLYKDWMAALHAEALRRGAASEGTQPSHLPNNFEAFPWADKENIWRDAFARGFCPAQALDEHGYRQTQSVTMHGPRWFWGRVVRTQKQVKASEEAEKTCGLNMAYF
jgi:hypothetical protein